MLPHLSEVNPQIVLNRLMHIDSHCGLCWTTSAHSIVVDALGAVAVLVRDVVGVTNVDVDFGELSTNGGKGEGRGQKGDKMSTT